MYEKGFVNLKIQWTGEGLAQRRLAQHDRAHASPRLLEEQAGMWVPDTAVQTANLSQKPLPGCRHCPPAQPPTLALGDD